jgi:hypothetical protein
VCPDLGPDTGKLNDVALPSDPVPNAERLVAELCVAVARSDGCSLETGKLNERPWLSVGRPGLGAEGFPVVPVGKTVDCPSDTGKLKEGLWLM